MNINKSTTFFEVLQNDKTLDLRDNRGKVHLVSLILTEFVIALLCNRDGKLSSIWRHMNNHHTQLVSELDLEYVAPKKQYQDLIYQFY